MDISGDRKDQPNEVTVYICSICKSNFSDNSEIFNHMTTVHKILEQKIKTTRGSTKKRKNTQRFICDVCPYKTVYITTFKRHRKRHEKDSHIKCPHCSYSTIQPYNLKLHIINMHPNGGVKPVEIVCESQELIDVILKKYTED